MQTSSSLEQPRRRLSIRRLVKPLQASWRLLPVQMRWRLNSLPVVSRLLRVASATLWRHADEDFYNDAYFQVIEDTSGAGARVMAESIVRRYAPARVVDVGCGTGVLLEHLRPFGVEVSGLEKSNVAIQRCIERGLDVRAFDLASDALPSLADVDLVICLEVANLIPEDAGQRCVELLCSVDGGTVLFSAGRPGQGGGHVINERPASYWQARFRQQGYGYDAEAAEELKRTWQDGKVASWFSQNLMVFKRGLHSIAMLPGFMQLMFGLESI